VNIRYKLRFVSMFLSSSSRLDILSLQRSHVDHKAILHIALEQTLISLVDLLDRDDLDVRGDLMLSAKVQHLLRLLNATDGRSSQPATFEYQGKSRDRQRVFGRTDERQRSVPFQQFQLSIQVVLGGHGVQDEVEAVEMFLHLILVF
jgi:hypothetical protein